MSISIRRSTIESHLFEVCRGAEVIEEISAPFAIRKIPSSFDSLEEVRRWLQETEWKLARLTAYRLIAMRSYCSPQLFRKIKEKGFSETICKGVIEELQNSGYLQDEEFEERAILREFQKGYGPRYIEMKLRSAGLGRLNIRKLITESMQREQIRRLIRKFSFGSSATSLQKGIRTLLRRGFDSEIVLKELKFSPPPVYTETT
ncbi:MAG: RecX family transcriptional regulator [Chlamydiota bacterium]